MTIPGRPSDPRLESLLEFERLISDTSAALFSAPPDNLDLAVERSLEWVRKFFLADRCVLLSVSSDQQVVNVRLASYGQGIPSVSPEINLGEFFPWSSHRLLVERLPIRISRMADLPPEAEVEVESWNQLQIRSALTIPIERAGSISHIIVLNSVKHECEWPDDFVTRLKVLGVLLAGALDRQKMFRNYRESENRLAKGAYLAGLAFYEVDFGEGTIFVDPALMELCGISPDRDKGLEPLDLWLERLHPEDRPRVLRVREELHNGSVDQITLEYRFLHPVFGPKWIKHLAGVATRNATGMAVTTYGVLRDITQRRRTEDELHNLSRQLINAHEDERALIARELHDDLSQRLAVMAIEIGRTEATVENPGYARTLRAVQENLVRLSEDIHALAYNLHPSVLNELGLVEALRTESERRGRQGLLNVSLDLDPLPAGLGKDEALCLFRVAQEALNNVSRHAGTDEANITLRQMDEGLLLAIDDRGVGFNQGSSGFKKHLGLVGMSERVRLVNGTLDVKSVPGQGTTISAWVPCGGGSP